ncbi:MAG: response regulator transcription factor [Gemmatimonadaceae bacterium]
MVKTRATIAIVDDDAGVRTALQQLLRSAGFEALAFASAEEFLAAGHDAASDFLIADVNLPGMSGVGLLKTLAEAGAQLPALLITGRDDAGTIELIRQAGPVPRLTKPFSDDDLFEVIEEALSEGGGTRK